MDFNVTENKNWRTVIDVIIPAEKVKPELDKNYQEYQTHVKLGGFRKGKVPMNLVKKMFGEEIERETFRPFISDAWKEIFKDRSLDNVINEPMITELKFDAEKGLTFNIEYDTRPEFDVTGYDGMAVNKTVFKVDKEDINSAIEDLRQRNAMIHTVEGEAQEENFILADLQELDESGVPVVGHKYENQQIWLSKDNTELVTQLAGVKGGDEKKITLTMKDEANEEGPEKKQDFNVTVKEIKERRLPELDDDFAKDVGPYEKFSELKENLEKTLKYQAEMETQLRFETELKNELIKIMDIEVPPSMLENYLAALISDYQKRSGGKEASNEQLREYYSPMAVRTIKWILIREKLIEKEKIEITDKELDAKIEELEKSENEQDQKQAKEYKESDDARQNLQDRLLEEKVIEFLTGKAKVKKETKSWREAYAENASTENVEE